MRNVAEECRHHDRGVLYVVGHAAPPLISLRVYQHCQPERTDLACERVGSLYLYELKLKNLIIID